MNHPTDNSTEDKQAGAEPQKVVRRDDLSTTKASADGSLMGRFKAIMAEPNDSTKKTLAVALILCLACSVMVSAAAVLLRPKQTENAALDRQRNILAVAGLWQPGEDVEAAFANVQRRMVDLETGEFTDKFMDVAYDQYVAARDPELGISIPSDKDIAGIGRKARYAEVFLVGGDNDFSQIILPVHGLGLWSTLYGFVSLESDLKTISGLKFYSHGETPGLGGEVDNLNWQAMWKGKLAYDDEDQVRIRVVKGTVDKNAPDAAFQADGLAGATLTSQGVSQLLRFWLDQQGFGGFLENLRQQGAS